MQKYIHLLTNLLVFNNCWHFGYPFDGGIVVYFCSLAESTHTVDGSPLWRLTLDDDLICTLRLRFPTWFDTNNSAISKSFSQFVHSQEPLVDVIDEMAEGSCRQQ